MRAGDKGDGGDLGRRIDGLFRAIYPKERGRPYSYQQVVDAINGEAGEHVISAPYLCELRRGKKTNPSLHQIAALERFFGAPAGFLSAPADDALVVDGFQQLELLELLKDKRVRGIALRAARLRSESSLSALEQTLDAVARAEAEDLYTDSTARGA